MHGRKRTTRDSLTKEDIENSLQKIFELRLLCSAVYKRYEEKDYSDESYKLTGQVLQQNPEIYTIWNFRRHIIAKKLSSLNEKEEVEAKLCVLKEIIKIEFEITFIALSKRNPKSYCAWYQRKWIIKEVQKTLENSDMLLEVEDVVDFEKEVELCSKLLEIDERNFHCWNYRNLIVSMLFCSDSVEYFSHELKFTLELIQRNFSNFSAWHRRIVIVESLLDSKVKLKALSFNIKKELSLVHNANFTEPADQSAWIYRKFLTELVVKREEFLEEREEVLKKEVVLMRELDSIEQKAVKNLTAMLELSVLLKETKIEGFSEVEMKKINQKLMELDPIKKKYYLALSTKLFKT